MCFCCWAAKFQVSGASFPNEGFNYSFSACPGTKSCDLYVTYKKKRPGLTNHPYMAYSTCDTPLAFQAIEKLNITLQKYFRIYTEMS